MNKPFTLLASFLLLLNACTMIPKKDPLNIEIPCSWRIDADEGSTLANVDWWKQFEDPVLDDLIAEALENNKDLEVAIWRVQEFEALWRYVSGNLYPQITGNGYATRQSLSLAQTPLPPGSSRIVDSYALSFNGLYQLDVWGKIRSGTDAAFAEFLAQEDARRAVVITVMGSVANSYVTLRQLDKQLEIAEKTLNSREHALKLAKIRYANGFTSELEVKQAASEVWAAAARINRIELLRNEQENLLCILVGRNPGPIERGLQLSQLRKVPCVPVGLPSGLLGQRPDILEAEQRLAAANALIGVARAAFFPDISLTGMLGVISPELKNLFSNDAQTWNYSTSLMQIIFDGGKLAAQLDAAEAVKQQAYYNYEKVIQNAFREVNDALVAHQLALELLQIQLERVAVLRDYLRLARLQHDNGQVDYLNVLDAERTLFAGELDYTEAESNTFTSLINLYTALGGGWQVDN